MVRILDNDSFYTVANQIHEDEYRTRSNQREANALIDTLSIMKCFGEYNLDRDNAIMFLQLSKPEDLKDAINHAHKFMNKLLASTSERYTLGVSR